MKGCLKGAGCLVILLLLAGLWFWYARVEPAAVTAPAAGDGAAKTAAPLTSGWRPLSEADAERGRVALQSLERRSGPVSVNLTPAQAASYIFMVVAKQLPPSAKNAEAAIIGDRLYVRSDVELKDFGGAKSLGPIGMLLGERDSVRFGGTINMLRPGLAEFVVHEAKLGRIDVPSALIPRLLSQMKRSRTVEGVSQNGLPMVMPPYISDVRISNGRITLYKSAR
jgi:hypothetical protein